MSIPLPTDRRILVITLILYVAPSWIGYQALTTSFVMQWIWNPTTGRRLTPSPTQTSANLRPTRPSWLLEFAKVKFRGSSKSSTGSIPVVPGACSRWIVLSIVGPVFECDPCASGLAAFLGREKSRSWGRMIKNKTTLIAPERLNIESAKKNNADGTGLWLCSNQRATERGRMTREYASG